MKIHICHLVLVLISSLSLHAQDFDFGKVSLKDLAMTTYEPDTSAGAVVLKEFGRAFITDGEGYHLVFEYRVRIKILKKSSLGEANIEIPLYKQDQNNFEKLTKLTASSFNIENGRIQEEVLSEKNVFTEEVNKYWDVRKFAIPNARVGSVIEFSYTLKSPFVYNYRSWDFQSDIPKVESEYWASLPGIYIYNITLRGYLKLTKNESSLVRNCLGSENAALYGGFSADCSLMKFGMKDIPAFVEEEYMTASKNFLSSIQFELSEVRYPDGRVDKKTKEWKDAELELRQESRFGGQLRRGRDIGQQVEKLIEGQKDDLARATAVYDFIRDWYVWNGMFGKYSEFGIKKAFDERKGNVGDINLSLVAALRFAGLNADPVILSTRANGTVLELHPVLSEFNYVVAKVDIGNRVYLADATEKAYPFGMLPERCLNGKGRVMGDGQSYWLDLTPSDIRKTVSVLSLVLDSVGVMRGSLQTTFIGYDAVRKRKEILSHESAAEYIRALNGELNEVEITSYEFQNLEDRQKPISRKLEIEFNVFDNPDAATFLFNPFLLDKLKQNPFKSRERQYPVDFGVPLEHVTIFNMQYPPDFQIVNVPERVGLSLPNGGGRFMLEVSNTGNKILMNNFLSIRKTIYTSEEYHYLKELFNRIIQIQNGDLVFKKKPEGSPLQNRACNHLAG